jgi:hypothetical protein
MFRTRETRLGKDVLYTPGTAVPTRPRMLHDRRLPHHNGMSLSPRHCFPARRVMLTRHHQGFPDSHPIPSLPLTCGPWTGQGPLGFPMSFAPGRYRPRTSWRGQVPDTDPKPRHRHQPASIQRTHSSRATSCRRHYAYLPVPGISIAWPPSPCGRCYRLPGRSLLLRLLRGLCHPGARAR